MTKGVSSLVIKDDDRFVSFGSRLAVGNIAWVVSSIWVLEKSEALGVDWLGSSDKRRKETSAGTLIDLSSNAGRPGMVATRR